MRVLMITDNGQDQRSRDILVMTCQRLRAMGHDAEIVDVMSDDDHTPVAALHDCRPNVVHVRLANLEPYRAVANAARDAKTLLACAMTDVDALEPTATQAKAGVIGRLLRRRRPQRHPSRVVHDVLTASDLITCPSSFALQLARDAGVPDGKMALIPWPIPRHRMPADPRGDHMLVLGPIDEDHGASVIAQAARIATELPIVIVGKRPLPEAFEGIPNVSVVRPDCDDKAPDGYLRRARAVIIADTVPPISDIEARTTLLRGTPVIASDTGALPEAVENGLTGVLVPTGDPAALAHAMRRLWDDPDMTLAMGRAGARLTSVDLDQHCVMLIQAYARALARKDAQ